MIDPQDEALSLVGESQANLRLMRLMDELHLNCPWCGSGAIGSVAIERAG